MERRQADPQSVGLSFSRHTTNIQAKFGKMHFFESRESKLEGAGFFQKQPISALAKKKPPTMSRASNELIDVSPSTGELHEGRHFRI